MTLVPRDEDSLCWPVHSQARPDLNFRQGVTAPSWLQSFGLACMGGGREVAVVCGLCSTISETLQVCFRLLLCPPTKPRAPLLKFCHWGSIPWLPPLSLSPNIPYQASPEEETHSAGSPDPFGNPEKIGVTGGLRGGWATKAFLAAGCVCWLQSWVSAGQRS